MSDELNALALYQGERVIWSHVQTSELEARKHWGGKPSTRRICVGVAVLGLLAIVVGGMRGGEFFGKEALFLIGTYLLAFTGLIVGSSYVLRHCFGKDYGGGLFGRTIAYFSCVITDRRIMLFDIPGEPVTSIPRSRLASAKQDFAIGGRALMLRETGSRDKHVFISPIDFTPALCALDR